MDSRWAYLGQILMMAGCPIFMAYLLWSGEEINRAHFCTATTLLFALFNIGVLLYAYRMSSSHNLMEYNNVVTVSFLGKLILSVAFLLLWQRHGPAIPNMVLHFILLYFIFTIHEVYFLTKLAYRRPKSA